MEGLKYAQLACEEVNDPAAFAALAEEWAALCCRCPDATPFQSPEWVLGWWERFGGAELLVLTLRDGPRLAGVAPFFIYRNARTGLRTASLIGAGISDYPDVLVEPELRSNALAVIFHRLAERSGAWDVCDFQDLRSGSPLLDDAAFSGPGIERRLESVCTVLPLPETVGQYYLSLPYMFRKRLRRARRAFERAPDARFEQAGRDTLPSFLEDLFSLHAARWESRDQPGVLADAEIRRFHAWLAPRFLEKNILRFYRMRLHGCTAAVLYGFMDRGRIYCYLSGFDPAFQQFSPGMAILNCAIEQAIREGAYECDFLRGREAYKYRWAVRERHMYRLLIRQTPTFAGDSG